MGKSCGDWLAGRVASVASEGKPDADAQQELAIDAHKATARDAAQYRDAVILVLGHVLYERGMTQDEAALTTQRVAAAADAVLMAASPA